MTAAAPRARPRLGRLAYAAASIAIFGAQYLIVAAVLVATGRPFVLPWWFWALPLRALILLAPDWALLAAMAGTLAVNTALVLLAQRRARDAGLGEGVAAFTFLPGLQIAGVLLLSLAPPRPELAEDELSSAARRLHVGLAVAIGGALSVAAVVVNAETLAIYGWTLFICSPFLIALVVALLSNLGEDIGRRRTFGRVLIALALGAVGLVLVAAEGAVCLVLASPLILSVAAFGAWVGARLAQGPARARRSAVFSFALLPILCLAEALLPPQLAFQQTESQVIQASPDAVWRAVVQMRPLTRPPPPPFAWGVAYPVAGRIQGQGVGAIRIGVFSTGEAREQVTDWRPGQRLALRVLSDPPAMRELSPYAHVDAPHVQGYFRTPLIVFDLQPLPGGRTRLSITGQHELDLEPALYWAPLARWVISANEQRVLEHIRRQAEGLPA